ncbi:type I glyceraldehyde-3-phosphate dehydrogenase [Alkalilimnicola ehrlichii]|uniref:Glyceraldehyde-3-phosphate dehydrogenase n=1 Tax=Alkalilimnicola ehrlichii TaxID=351052 RepID=A0A3E0X2B0_9GAMM|nr:glyceraldehyde-3-phosphate dehydrogenase [Alkalilimnicola ehrlichii]RFA30747.1 type I glyceraldehyde-3-phosphate dehydrogenase [Alkalilimnicola ehrlichii]RFA38323.1 type I glyceraldehyde-3-phosphate dehydrogenase [Alkalilimnicola ehrlichii]
MNQKAPDAYLNDWTQRQELAERMLPMIGKLYRDKGIVLRIYGRPLINCTTIDILKAHRFVKQYETEGLSIHNSFPILEQLSKMELSPARIDLGKLTTGYLNEAEKEESIEDYLKRKLANILGGRGKLQLDKPQDVVLYGFGRIGRLLARLLIERTGSGNKMRLRAIVVRKGKGHDIEKRASLLRRDSVHGPFNGTIHTLEDANAIIANGNFIQIIYADSPDTIDYTQYGIEDALVVDNTGKWRDEEGLSLHLKSKGVSKVLLTAPGKGDLPNIVYGVNHNDIKGDEKIVSAASCTTNAIVPVLKALNDEYGIQHGHVETVHSYTNDQNLIDNYHPGARRGRGAALNMVLTETGAAKAVAKALPELKGKLTGNAIRVPTPNVSMAVLNLSLGRETSKEELNAYLRDIALHSELQEQIDYTASTELVSSDLVGSRHAGVVDSASTIVNGDKCVLYVWYDNEFGYSCQVVRVMQEMVGICFPNLP